MIFKRLYQVRDPGAAPPGVPRVSSDPKPGRRISVSGKENAQTTDFDEIVETSENLKTELGRLTLVKWSKEETSHFEMFEKYLNHRGKRIWFVLQIFATRLFCIGLTILASIFMYNYFIEDAISDDGRNLGVAFQCKLPSQYWEVEGNFTKKTVDCYLKGRKTLKLFTWAMIGFYAAINLYMLLSIFMGRVYFAFACKTVSKSVYFL